MKNKTGKFLLLFSVSSNEKDLQAIKEDLAYYCEKFGDVSLIDIQETVSQFQQIKLEYPDSFQKKGAD